MMPHAACGEAKTCGSGTLHKYAAALARTPSMRFGSGERRISASPYVYLVHLDVCDEQIPFRLFVASFLGVRGAGESGDYRGLPEAGVSFKKNAADFPSIGPLQRSTHLNGRGSQTRFSIDCGGNQEVTMITDLNRFLFDLSDLQPTGQAKDW